MDRLIFKSLTDWKSKKTVVKRGKTGCENLYS